MSDETQPEPVPDEPEPVRETKAERLERETRERGELAEADAAFLIGFEPDDRLARAVEQGWTGARTQRALAIARLRTPQPEPKDRIRVDVATVADDGRPTIKITTALRAVVDASEKALASDPATFSRGPVLSQVIHATCADKEKRIVAGTPQARPMALATLREKLSDAAQYWKFDKRSEQWHPALPPDAVVQALLARGEWPELRELRGIIEAPSMRPDGTIIETPGYDAATGFFYAPAAIFPQVTDAPTQADAARALLALNEVFIDFPWESEAARCVPIAAALAIIARPAILGAVPAFLFDAHTPGTGKTLAADAVCCLATGRTSPRGTFPASAEELEKVMASYAMQGASIVGFDNVPVGVGFGGAALDKALTAVSTVTFRVLGKTESPELPWTGIVIASGNNLTIIADTVRRVFIGRMSATTEKPEERTGFKHSPLLPWVLEQRPRLVTAALTVLRAYVFAGRPGKVSLGSFEAFAELIASAIIYAGGANVLDARPGEDAGDDGDHAHRAALLEGWPRLDVDGHGMTTRTAIQVLYPADRHERPRPPDGHDALREAIEGLTCTPAGKTPDTGKLGRQLRSFKGRIIGGKRLVGKTEHNALRWRVTDAR